MRKILLFLLISIGGFAQKSTFMGISAGHTFMGTGDLRGFNIGASIQHSIKKYFGVEVNLRATSASGSSEFGLNNTSNSGFNEELRFSTTGFQVEGLAKFPILNKGLRFSILAGPVLRRQFNTRPNVYGSNSLQDFRALSVRYEKPYISHSIGATVQLDLSFRLNPKSYFGIRFAGHGYPGDLNWYLPLVFYHQI